MFILYKMHIVRIEEARYVRISTTFHVLPTSTAYIIYSSIFALFLVIAVYR